MGGGGVKKEERDYKAERERGGGRGARGRGRGGRMKMGGDRPSSGQGGEEMEEWETASESSEKSDLKGKNNFVGGSSKENTPKDSSLGRGGGAKKNYGSSQRG